MAGLGFLLLAVLCLLLLSAFTDGQWGRGVRGALSGLSSDDAGSVRDRVSATASGARLGWRDKTPSTRRTVGKTPPQDSLLSGVLSKLSGLSSRTVRAVRDRVSGRQDTSGTKRQTPMLLVRPDGTAEHIDWDEQSPLPRLAPGERIHWLDRFGAIDNEIGTPITYDDQQPGGIDYLDPKSDVEDGTTQPIPAVPAAEPNQGESMESTEPSEWTARRERQADRDARYPGAAAEAREDATRQRGGSPLNNSGNTMAGAIENLPSYERFLSSTRDKVLGEMEDAKSGAQRHVQLSSSVADGMGRLAVLRVDPATLGEGGQVAERAAIVRVRSEALASALADLDSAVQAAQAGVKRQQPAQELANSNVLAERPAYDGA